MMDLDWIRQLIELVDESGIDSLEVSRFGTSVKIRKSPPAPGPAPVATGSRSAAASPAAGTRDAAGAEVSGAPEAAGGPEGTEEPAGDEDLHAIESPMVGTFYRAPAPDAPPYVEVGDHVEKGQTLCILEAMKLMNELESEVSGEIREICVQNADPVEYGEVLFRISPDGTG